MSSDFNADAANARQHAKTIQLLDHLALGVEELLKAHLALARKFELLEKQIGDTGK